MDNIKKWYKKTFPTDTMGDDINDAASFKYLEKNLPNVYGYIGAHDSIIRERVFTELANKKNVPYDTIYHGQPGWHVKTVLGPPTRTVDNAWVYEHDHPTYMAVLGFQDDKIVHKTWYPYPPTKAELDQPLHELTGRVPPAPPTDASVPDDTQTPTPPKSNGDPGMIDDRPVGVIPPEAP